HLLRYGRRHVERLSPHPFQPSREGEKERNGRKVLRTHIPQVRPHSLTLATVRQQLTQVK
ncbi:MAG: hypothetical protein AAB242_06960, partial [Nitrospirota bacterium]